MTEVDLSKCAICGDPAQFTDADPGALPVSYDAKHLPEHFRQRAEAGQMPLQDGSTVEELQKQAKKLDIEGRSTMTKAQLQTAVAAAAATEMAQGRNSQVDPRVPPVPADPDVPTPERPVRLSPEAEGVEQQYVTEVSASTEEGSMSDAMPDVELEAPAPAPKATRKGARKK